MVATMQEGATGLHGSVCESRVKSLREMMSFGTAGHLYGKHPALALASISTAHFNHPNYSISRVTKFTSAASPPYKPALPTHHISTANMRPILLSGHERALTQVKYNADGDIIFSVSKDHVVCAWC